MHKICAAIYYIHSYKSQRFKARKYINYIKKWKLRYQIIRFWLSKIIGTNETCNELMEY